METIYLIGFMGSGKSTVGGEYARKYSKTYVDTDNFIEEFHQKKISVIFSEKGEDAFRVLESDALMRVSNYEVVSTGGGIVENIGNLHTMRKNGTIFYLHATLPEVSDRLKDDQTRPLWKSNNEERYILYNRRIPLYRKFADHTIDTGNKTVDEIIEEIYHLR